jgi:hypothetical protein
MSLNLLLPASSASEKVTVTVIGGVARTALSSGSEDTSSAWARTGRAR